MPGKKKGRCGRILIFLLSMFMITPCYSILDDNDKSFCKNMFNEAKIISKNKGKTGVNYAVLFDVISKNLMEHDEAIINETVNGFRTFKTRKSARKYILKRAGLAEEPEIEDIPENRIIGTEAKEPVIEQTKEEKPIHITPNYLGLIHCQKSYPKTTFIRPKYYRTPGVAPIVPDYDSTEFQEVNFINGNNIEVSSITQNVYGCSFETLKFTDISFPKPETTVVNETVAPSYTRRVIDSTISALHGVYEFYKDKNRDICFTLLGVSIGATVYRVFAGDPTAIPEAIKDIRDVLIEAYEAAGRPANFFGPVGMAYVYGARD
jgi:hypothetical protein